MVRYTGENQFTVEGITYSTIKVEYVENNSNQSWEDQDCLCFNIKTDEKMSGLAPVAIVHIDVAHYNGRVKIADTVKYEGREYVIVLLKPYSFNAEELISITMPKYIPMIFTGTFENCINLEYVCPPPYLRYIEERAFSGCAKLENLLITPRVSYIESYAFEGCTGMTGLFILSFPDSPQCRTEEFAFTDCVNIKRVGLIESSREEAKKMKENKDIQPKVTSYSSHKPGVLLCNHIPLLFQLARSKSTGKEKLHFRYFEVVL